MHENYPYFNNAGYWCNSDIITMNFITVKTNYRVLKPDRYKEVLKIRVQPVGVGSKRLFGRLLLII